MKRYLVVGFLVLVPLYGIRKATEEVVKGMTTPRAAKITSKTEFTKNLIAVDSDFRTHQFKNAGE